MAKKLTYKNILASSEAKNEVNTITINVGGEEMSIEISKRIDMDKMLKLVNGATNSIIDIDAGTYAPELNDFLIKLYVLYYYAGFPLPGKDLSEAYRVIYETPLYGEVMKHVDYKQVAEISEAVYERVEYLRDISTSSAAVKVNNLLSKIDQLFEMMESIGESLDTNGLKDAVASLTKMMDGSQDQQPIQSADGDNVVKLPRARVKSVSKA